MRNGKHGAKEHESMTRRANNEASEEKGIILQPKEEGENQNQRNFAYCQACKKQEAKGGEI